MSEALLKGESSGDDALAEIVNDAINSVEAVNGFILSGYPQTVAQAQRLGEMLAARGDALDAVVELDVADRAVLVQRIRGRMVHAPSGRVYHTESAPPSKHNESSALINF